MGYLRNFEIGVFRRVRREPPRGKVHRLAFWLLIAYLLFGIGRLLPGPTGAVFSGISAVVLIVLVVLCIPLFWRLVMSRVLWKVRNRLVVTYLLMALTPVVLFVSLALILLYVFSGQFAIFAATAEIQSELAHIASQNRSFAMHVANDVAADPRIHIVPRPDVEDSRDGHGHKGLEMAAFENTQPLALDPDTVDHRDLARIPPWAHDRFSAVVVDKGKLFLRAVDMQTIDGRTVTTITSMPLETSNMDQIANGLGTVTLIVPDMHLTDGETTVNAKGGYTKIQIGKPSGESGVKINGQDVDVEATRRGAVQGGALPGPEHFYDIPVTFYAPLDTIDWVSGRPYNTVTHVTSRPSLLYRRLFNSSLQIAAFVRATLIGIAVLFGVLELLAFFMAVRLNRTITRSIRDLYLATTAIDRGDFAHRIEVTRHDQLAALSTSFNTMTASLERLLVEQREKERLQNELAIAQEVQANLFPRGDVALSMLELHGACYPARTVSGDYYDFLVFNRTCLGLALGDISGKGISAALLMATLHSAVRAYRLAGEELVSAGTAALAHPATRALGEEEVESAEMFEQPSRILGLLNRHLYRSTQPEKYATLFLAHYDGARRRVVYANGGHLPPLLLRSDDAITRLECGGTVVGLLDNMSYEQGSEIMEEGDILIAYSDGVTEPENEFGEFGEERLIEVVRRHRHLPLSAISEQVMQSLRTWIGGQEQPDDITLVLARQR
jgi:sigma-B regulation protein RsbU (phosphoserine phosphatase)